MLLGCLQARSRPHSLDADLGLRLARCGARVGMIAPPTLEAPLEQMGVWLAQRSRWLKGFLQTWLVLMCTPAASIWEMELTGFVSMKLALGAAILSAVVPSGSLPAGLVARFARDRRDGDVIPRRGGDRSWRAGAGDHGSLR